MMLLVTSSAHRTWARGVLISGEGKKLARCNFEKGYRPGWAYTTVKVYH